MGKNTVSRRLGFLPLRVAVLYVIFGGLWVFATDRIVEFLIPDAVGVVQTTKGVLFVLGSAALIYLVILQQLRARRETVDLLIMSRIRRRSLRRRMASLVVAAPVAIIETDPDGRVVVWNKEAERLFGWTADEVLNRPLPFIADEERSLYEDLQRRVTAGEVVSDVETRRLRKDGTSIPVSVFAAPIVDRDGRFEGAMRVILDLSERKELEEQLIEARRMEAVGMLAHGLAHDVNNLLTAVLGHVDFALERLGSDDARAEIEDIRFVATRAVALTGRLLALARRRGPEGFAQHRAEHLGTVVEEMEQTFRRMLGSAIRLRVDIDADPLVPLDRTEIEQIVLNLVVNARDAMPDGGDLRIEVSTEPVEGQDRAVLVVADTGVGIDDGVVERIFEPFFTSKAERRNSGLGLASVRAVVDQANGKIDVGTQPSRGTTFRITVPVLEETPDGRLIRTAAPERPREGIRVLLVEDDLEVQTVARGVLEREGYLVTTAETLAAATAAGTGERVDLLVCESLLPDGPGTAVAEWLRGRGPEVAVLYLSDSADDRLTEPGAPVLTKPFDPRRLVEFVREALGSSVR